MMTQEDLERFLNWPADPKKRVLSVYLDVDPSWDKFPKRKFEVDFNAMVDSLAPAIEEGLLEEFEKDAKRAGEFISSYQPKGRGLILFADDSENFIWSKEVKLRLSSQIHWLVRPYALPLLEMFDEYERYGVILVEKGKARIFTYILGEVEEEQDALPVNEVRPKKTSGMDHMRSQMNFQRTAELHVTWHLKHVAKLVQKMASHRQLNRFILGGSREAVDELAKRLPLDLRHQISGRLSLPVETPEKELEEALIEIEARIEREKENELVRKLVHPDFPSERILGLEGVTPYVDKALIHKLIYSENFKPAGGRCQGCGYLYADKRFVCGRCESKIDALPNFLEEIARAVVLQGGSLEEVKGDAAKELDREGSIGAILRDRSR